MRKLILPTLSALAISLVLTTGAEAVPVPASGQNFIDFGVTMAAPTGDINTATTFTFGNLLTGAVQSGIFVGFPILESFGSVTFDIDDPASLVVSHPDFGTFTSTSITQVASSPGFLNLVVDGVWMPGSLFPELAGQTITDGFNISFTQNPAGASGIIAGSAVFEFSAQNTVPSVPEPSNLALFLAGLAGLLVAYRFTARRWRGFDRGAWD